MPSAGRRFYRRSNGGSEMKPGSTILTLDRVQLIAAQILNLSPTHQR